MNFLNNIKIGLRLNIIISLLMACIIASLGIYTLIKQRNQIFSDTKVRMSEQVGDLAEMVNIQISQNEEKVRAIGNVTLKNFYSMGELTFGDNAQSINVTNQNTLSRKKIDLPELLVGGNPIYNNFDFVDEIENQTNANATIFQRIDGGFVRISTNIKKNGQRSIDTYIPNSSPVVQTIEGNGVYYGRAKVVDKWFLTAYYPIKINDKVEAIFSVGIQEKDMQRLKGLFNSKKYFDSGYPFIVDNTGTMIIHPTKEGVNLKDEEFFQQLIESSTTSGETTYIFDGKRKRQYFKYVESIESYVCVSIYEHELMNIITQIRRAILIVLIFGIGLFVLINMLISGTITTALKRGIDFAESIAAGDLSNNLDIDQKDEIGQLANALNKMVNKLKEIVGGVIQSADNIASASQQLSSTSQQLSQGASEQASSVEEVSSTMEEMAANIQQNTDNATQTEKISASAQTGVQIVSEKSQESINANRTISEKINIINDIAFQTNILALNAAVEAARAGDHGKGFAVVASEVRKLAENSKKAADEIVALAAKSLKLAEEAGEQMGKTQPMIENSTQLVKEIAAASFEQNNGAQQVNTAISQLNNVTQQNAAASEEMATSSEELASQAELMKDAINYFSIDERLRSRAAKTKITASKTPQSSKSKAGSANTANKGYDIKLIKSSEKDDDFETF